MRTTEITRKDLAPYFARQGEILLASIFGSVAQGRMSELSDVDIALLASARWRT